jgi:hypothetical protein
VNAPWLFVASVGGKPHLKTQEDPMADTQRSQAAQEIEQAAKSAGSPATFGEGGITLKLLGGEVQLTEDTLHGGFRVEKLKAADGKEAERLGRFHLHGVMTALDVVGNLREQEAVRLEAERVEAQRLEGARSQEAAAKAEAAAKKPAPAPADHSRQHRRSDE